MFENRLKILAPILLGLGIVVLAGALGFLLARDPARLDPPVPPRPQPVETRVPEPRLVPTATAASDLEEVVATATQTDIPLPTEPPPPTRQWVDPATPEEGLSSDRDYLETTAARYAYIEYGGVLNGTPVAVFHDNLRHSNVTAVQGALFHGLTVLSVTPEQVSLGFGESDPLLKPRVELVIDATAVRDTGPEMAAQKLQRYMELHGNLQQVAARKEQDSVLNREPQSPDPEVQALARQKYEEQMATYLRKLRDVSPEEALPPPGQILLEQDVKHYFETYWPEVEAELEARENQSGETGQ